MLYRVETGEDHVRCWTSSVLPFEPRDWQRQLRLDLIAGIGRLAEAPTGLDVRFWDRDKRIHDLENAVLYNLGPGRFACFLPHGIRLRRSQFSFLKPHTAPFPVAGEYEFAHRSAGNPQPSSTHIGQVSFEILDTGFRTTNVFEVWRATRAALTREVALTRLEDRRLGVSVTGGALTTSSIKPFLDGVLSALHSADDQTSLAAMRILGASNQELASLATWAGPLGRRQLLRLTRGGRSIVWNPADDLFDEIVLRPRPGDAFQVSICPLDF
jgi:hypothetical protein